MSVINRRRMLGMSSLAVLGSMTANSPAEAQQMDGKKAPSFLNVRDFDAINDGTRLVSAAINRAINLCHAGGGGIVYVPAGIYLCGTVELMSNVTLFLEAGATLLGSKNLADYTAHPYGQTDEMKKRRSVFENDAHDTSPYHLIFAQNAENIGLTGPGQLDGQGATYWTPSGRAPLPPEDAWQDVATLAWKAIPRPSPMLEFNNCKNVRIEDVQIRNSAGWTVRSLDCDNVFIRGVFIKNLHGINTDGLDLIGCKNVFVSDSLIDTGDDAICLKSESPCGHEAHDSKNITITNCVLTCCCNALKLGTASFGRFENITFSNSIIFNEDVELKSRVISGIALETVDGGSIEGILISNIRMQRVRTPLFMRIGNRQRHGNIGTLRGVMIENVFATGSILTSSITGLPDFEIEDVTLSGIQFESEEGGKADWAKRAIPEIPAAYPEARMFGRLPAYGLYCRHAKGLKLREVNFKACATEERPAIVCDDVRDLSINGLNSTRISGCQPVIRLTQTIRASIQGCIAPPETDTYLEVQGNQTEQIVLINNNLLNARKIVQPAKDVKEKAVTVAGNATAAS